MQQNPRALHVAPSVALVRVGADPPRLALSGQLMPISHEQYTAVLAAARATDHRLLLKVLWQSGARITEALWLRPCDVDQADASLRLLNEKQQRRATRTKVVYISRDLAAELLAFARGAHVRAAMPYFRSIKSGPRQPMSRGQAWRIVTDCSRRAGVLVPGRYGVLVPATPLNFRHGSAVHQLRQGVPVSEVQRQLGHARLESTVVYLRMTDAERRAIADRVAW